MHIPYKLVARMKRDPERKFYRAWPKGDNTGRDARQVADELATGLRKEFIDWTASTSLNDDDEFEQPFEALPNDFDDFIQPEFPLENDTFRSFAALNLDDEEDEDSLPQLQIRAGESQRAIASTGNPFNRTSVLPNKRSRDARPAEPARTAAGYIKAAAPVVKEEVMSEDSSEDEDERARKKKQQAALFRKQKPGKGKARAISVKQEDSDDEEGWA